MASDSRHEMDQKNKTETKSDPPIDEPLARFIKTYIDQQLVAREAAKTEGPRKSWKRSWRSTSPVNKATLIFAAIAAISTFFYSVIALSQLRVMSDSSDTSTDQGNRIIRSAETNVRTAAQSAAAAKMFSDSADRIRGGVDSAVVKLGEQATTMHDQLNVSRQSAMNAELSQMQVGLPIIEVSGNDLAREDGMIVDKQTFRNIGETRAVGPIISMGWGPKRLDKDTTFQWHSEVWKGITWTKNRDFAITLPFLPGEADRLDTIRPLFVYGEVIYTDVFPISPVHPSNRHIYEFSLKIVRTNLAVPSWAGDGATFYVCQDEACPHYQQQTSR